MRVEHISINNDSKLILSKGKGRTGRVQKWPLVRDACGKGTGWQAASGTRENLLHPRIGMSCPKRKDKATPNQGWPWP